MVEPFYHIYRVFSKVEPSTIDYPSDEVATTSNYSNAYELACYYLDKYGCADVFYELHEREVIAPNDKGNKVFEKRVFSFREGKKEHYNE